MKFTLKTLLIFFISVTVTACITRVKVDPDFKNIKEDIIAISLMPHHISVMKYDSTGVPELDIDLNKELSKNINSEITDILSKKYRILPNEEGNQESFSGTYYQDLESLVKELDQPGKSLMEVKVPLSLCQKTIYKYNMICTYNGYYKTKTRIEKEEEYVKKMKDSNGNPQILAPQTLELPPYKSEMAIILFNKNTREVVYFTKQFSTSHPKNEKELNKKLKYYLRDLYYKTFSI